MTTAQQREGKKEMTIRVLKLVRSMAPKINRTINKVESDSEGLVPKVFTPFLGALCV